MSVMLTVLRRHGATIGERHGRRVPVHFGSVASEEAVCRSGVGLSERSDRAMLEVRGTGADVDGALGELVSLRSHAWCLRCSPQRAIVRCEADDADACVAAMRRIDDLAITDVAIEHAALVLVGPRTDEVLEASQLEREDAVLVVRRDPLSVELLVGRAQGPGLWHQLLEAGAPFGIACVGVDATEHLQVSDQLGGLRRA